MAKDNEEMTQQPTSRQRLAERYKGRNPEINTDDDEALGAAILGDLDAYDQDSERLRRFNETVNSSDIAPEMMAGILSGKNADGTDFSLEEYIIDNNIDFFLDYIENSETAKDKLARRKEERALREKADEEFMRSELYTMAVEDFEYNTLRALPYQHEHAPLIVEGFYVDGERWAGFKEA